MSISPPLGKADLHIHSSADDGLASPVAIVDYVERHTDLDLIAITDHDTLEGGLEAAEWAARKNYRVQVMTGIEVSSRGGHVLALGVTRPIRMLQSLEDTLAAACDQGGFVIIPHPLSWLTFSVGQRALERVLQDGRPQVRVAGVETLNPSFAGHVAHARALQLNRQRWHLPETGGSDAHSLSLIGTAYTRFEGHTAEDFRRSLAAGTTQACGRFWSLSDHTRIAGQQLWRALVAAPARRFPRALRMWWRERHPPEAPA